MLTNGYDYIFALSWDAVNDILTANLKDKDIGFQASQKDNDLDLTVTLTVKLDPLQIVAGGGNSLVRLSLPIREGHMEIDGGATPSLLDLAGVSIIVETSLVWLGSGGQQQASGDASSNQLAFLPASPTASDPGGVAFVTLNDPHNVLTSYGKAFLSQNIVDILIANQDVLQYIFATINPTPADVASWLRPVKWQYFNVYSETGPCALAFLCQLSDKPFPPQPTFDAANLSPDHNTLLLISQKVFFDNVVLPSAQAVFPGGSFSATVNNAEQATVKSNGTFSMDSTQVYSYTATALNDDSGLQVSVSGGGPLASLFDFDLPDSSYSWSVTSHNPLQLSNGNLILSKDPNPVTTHDQSISAGAWIILGLEAGISDLGSIALLEVDAVNNLYAALGGLGMDSINTVLDSSLGSSTVSLTNLVDWNTTTRSFTPVAAGLVTALYIRGGLVQS
jgi:hypothetical protein